MKKVLILFGGNSYEHDISYLSATNVINNIDESLFYYDIALISKKNEWFLIKDQKIDLLENGNKIEDIISFLKNYDVVFPIMHGAFGEDGRIQSFFELFNIKYVGCDSSSSKVCMDKSLTKLLAEKHDIKQVPYFCLNEPSKKCLLEYPVIIKPANGGSSIGINIANNDIEFQEAMIKSFNYDSKLVVEKFISCREVECAIIEDDELIVGEVGEIKSCNEFYDYEAKYVGNSKLIIPADIDNAVRIKIQELTKKIFKIFNLKDFARIDFLYDEVNNIIYFNEINTIPGFTNISMFPLLFKEKGYNFKDIISKILS